MVDSEDRRNTMFQELRDLVLRMDERSQAGSASVTIALEGFRNTFAKLENRLDKRDDQIMAQERHLLQLDNRVNSIITALTESRVDELAMLSRITSIENQLQQLNIDREANRRALKIATAMTPILAALAGYGGATLGV